MIDTMPTKSRKSNEKTTKLFPDELIDPLLARADGGRNSGPWRRWEQVIPSFAYPPLGTQSIRP